MTFLFALPGELDIALHAACQEDAEWQLRRLGYSSYRLERCQP